MDKRISLFIARMTDKKLTLALAESMTCGLAAHKLSTCPGTSEVLKGSVVCYHQDVKKQLLKVPAALISKHSAESMPVTEKLTRALKKIIKADIHAAITGLASAGGSETSTKPVGTVFFCVTIGNEAFKERKVYRGTPLQIREKACFGLYKLITSRILLKSKKK